LVAFAESDALIALQHELSRTTSAICAQTSAYAG
jgi:hypothetical protein